MARIVPGKTLTRSASEGLTTNGPRWRFGLVCRTTDGPRWRFGLVCGTTNGPRWRFGLVCPTTNGPRWRFGLVCGTANGPRWRFGLVCGTANGPRWRFGLVCGTTDGSRWRFGLVCRTAGRHLAGHEESRRASLGIDAPVLENLDSVDQPFVRRGRHSCLSWQGRGASGACVTTRSVVTRRVCPREQAGEADRNVCPPEVLVGCVKRTTTRSAWCVSRTLRTYGLKFVFVGRRTRGSARRRASSRSWRSWWRTRRFRDGSAISTATVPSSCETRTFHDKNYVGRYFRRKTCFTCSRASPSLSISAGVL